MAITLDATDQSTFDVLADFVDEDGAPTVPVTMTWTLLDGYGDVVNSQADVPVSPLAASVTITLSGDDIIYTGVAAADIRKILFDGTYNHTSGVKPIRKCETFNVVSACS